MITFSMLEAYATRDQIEEKIKIRSLRPAKKRK